ncbi:MAG: iron-sulfur cluster assembly scaffold protein [Candidatus Cyclonatronum sp.]|uniref:iron-sulfur cluster assembly scaffold protein n=1 Tax=Cyclonatronum sp. TaxID=3024185 RepID=UPI0025BCEBAA|nr:iron-sulfur cluster assembly scaffold protein [Cyclonatronum sp.]MCH8486228.1 iron-sulfur cluster assembly scaffold protein [Cyclonatronum sp.]
MSTSLYTQKLIEASRNTENRLSPGSKPDQFDFHIQGQNPVCGDRVIFFVTMDGDRIAGISYDVAGCLMSQASAAFLAVFARGKAPEQLRALYEEISRITSPDGPGPDPAADEQLAAAKPWLALAQIRDYPARRKCVMMAWDALMKQLPSLQ